MKRLPIDPFPRSQSIVPGKMVVQLLERVCPSVVRIVRGLEPAEEDLLDWRVRKRIKDLDECTVEHNDEHDEQRRHATQRSGENSAARGYRWTLPARPEEREQGNHNGDGDHRDCLDAVAALCDDCESEHAADDGDPSR